MNRPVANGANGAPRYIHQLELIAMSESILIGYEEVSALLGGVPINTLKDYRAKGKGPRSAVIGGKVKYRRADVLAWIDERFQNSAKGGNVERTFKPLGKRSLVNA